MDLFVETITILKINGKFVKGTIKKPDKLYTTKNGFAASDVYKFYPDNEMKEKVDTVMESKTVELFMNELDQMKKLVDAHNVAEKLSKEDNSVE